ncbi:MAG: methyltransferase type 11 [Microgenomates group bacterium Gr01-1014_80]|nr:MAG: methyltransferase type 11 [Microgenomates group bacterium Gr01-1014_80]
MNNNLVREGYNKVAEHYSTERDQFKNDRYLDGLIKLLKPGVTILDLGCGAGLPIDRYLIDRGFRIVGVDLSEKQIELAKKNIPQATYEVGDISALQDGQYQVNAVVSFYAIFHTPREKHQDIIKRIHSFLVDGGLILITMGAGEWEGTEENFHGTKMWWSHYGSEKNRELIENEGFEIILDEIDTSGGEKHQIIMAKKR